VKLPKNGLRIEMARGGSTFVLLFVSLTVMLSGCGSSAAKRATSTAKPESSLNFGHFAGYVWRGRTTALSASWSVPRVLGGSGVAGTWIGAQAPANRGFIQIGTNEERHSGAGVPNYFAFWTNKAHHYRAIGLFEVHAGDRISASLKLLRARWHLEIVDASSGIARSFEKSEEGKASFNEAQWQQEDVTDEKTKKVFAYPQLSPVGFRKLAVDLRVPSYADVRSAWMSVGAVNFAPTPLHDDAFTIAPAKLSAGGRQYLRIAKVEDDATSALETQFLSLTKRTPRAKILGSIERFRGVLERNAEEVAKARWPKQIEPLAQELTQAARSTAASISVALERRSSPAQIRAMLSRNSTGVAGLRIRRARHVPDLP
jgi:hypothetical protein